MKRSPLRRVSVRRARDNRKRAKLLKGRRGPGPTLCEARLEGCWGTVVDGHEIHTAGRGGSRVDLSNVADQCRWCHDIITQNPSWADRHGWTLPSHCTPSDIRVARMIRAEYRCPKTCAVDHREQPLAIAT